MTEDELRSALREKLAERAAARGVVLSEDRLEALIDGFIERVREGSK